MLPDLINSSGAITLQVDGRSREGCCARNPAPGCSRALAELASHWSSSSREWQMPNDQLPHTVLRIMDVLSGSG